MDDRYWMKEALKEAKTASDKGEIPVGAIIVKDDCVISRAHNLCECSHDPMQHAEILAMRAAYTMLGSLSGCTMYVTLEPCAMCAGAIIHMRLPRLVFGAFDKANGCCGSRVDFTDHWFDHSAETTGGICEEECASLLELFFRNLRAE